jgi:hypothetical protein
MGPIVGDFEEAVQTRHWAVHVAYVLAISMFCVIDAQVDLLKWLSPVGALH